MLNPAESYSLLPMQNKFSNLVKTSKFSSLIALLCIKQGGAASHPDPSSEIHEFCGRLPEDVTLEKLDSWFEEAGLLGDNKQVTKQDTSVAFSKFSKYASFKIMPRYFYAPNSLFFLNVLST